MWGGQDETRTVNFAIASERCLRDLVQNGIVRLGVAWDGFAEIPKGNLLLFRCQCGLLLRRRRRASWRRRHGLSDGSVVVARRQLKWLLGLHRPIFD